MGDLLDPDEAMDILNKTSAPLTLSLPGGKKLRLGPGRTGQITPKAGEYPPIRERIESGDLEVLDEGKSKGSAGGPGGPGGSQRSAPQKGIRHTGDR